MSQTKAASAKYLVVDAYICSVHAKSYDTEMKTYNMITGAGSCSDLAPVRPCPTG